MAATSQRKTRLAAALVLACACLGLAGVVIPGKLFGPSKNATLEATAEPDGSADSGSLAARTLENVLRIPASDPPESRPGQAGGLFFWPEELAAGKSIVEIWKEEDSRLPLSTDPAPEAPATRPRVAPEEIEKVRAIAVRGIVVGPNGSWAILSTGRVKRNDRIPGSPFRVESIGATSITLLAEDERVVLELPSSRPGRVRTVAR